MRAMLRRVLILTAVLVALGAGAVLLRGPLVRHFVHKAMDRASARLGLAVSAESLEPEGIGGVRFLGVRVGDPARPIVTAALIDAWAPPRDLLRGRRLPARIFVRDFVIEIAGDGTPEGLLDALRALRPAPSAEAPPDPAAPVFPRPRVLLRGGRFIDRGGVVVAEALDGQIDPEGRVTLTFALQRPSPARCSLAGTVDRVDVQCEQPVALPIRKGIAIEIPQVTWQRGPDAYAEIRGARLRGEGLPAVVEPMLDGLGFEARLGFQKGPDESRPLRAALTFPAGGRIEATGTVSPKAAALRTEVTDLDLTPVSTTLAGQCSARVSLTVDLVGRRADLEGDVQLTNLLVEHRAIADDKVGPYSLGIQGHISVEQLADADSPAPPPSAPPSGAATDPALAGPENEVRPPRIRLSLSDAIVHLGEVAVRVDALLEADNALRKAVAHVDTGRLDGSKLVTAFPPGLLPHLQPLRATGTGRLGFDMNIDMDQPENTDLQVTADFKELEITRLNPGIDFELLRRTFETHFEMPDGEVLVNVTGPESERWTPLDKVAPLVPLAIVAQEDGGFWNHKGISLLHLRGSLQANVEKRRFARGGSTLTMQLARNIFLNRHKTLSRKLEEVIVAWQLEQTFSKTELMELYVNVVEFGPKLFGIGDASRYYFAKQPAELTPVEVAFLVRLLPNPRKFHEQFEKGEIREYYAASMMRLLALLVDRGLLDRPALDAADPRSLFVRPP
jgi:hypothetical protein